MSRGTEPPLTADDENEEDTIKIMLATDNHIGYLERDPIRGRDSFDTFEEILQLAVKHDVDFILLAGDLFHENRPSRECIYRVIALLRQYTMGDKPIQIELLSDPDEGKAAGFPFPAINYEDPNLNVGIPVFSIHGNHDDPQGAGPEGALCALDLLSVTGLLNYMGKIDLPTSDANADTTGIAVKPVLLQKGNTKLGLYGIGNVKDARMHFELRGNRVRMYMPRDKEDWFNILLLHQNRVKRGPQEAVPEGMFDDSVNLVVWGHEHDCRIVPEPVAGKDYYITQPGSSVATSLADGEALEKHVAFLEIRGKEFNLQPIPLRTVRPFVLDDIVLTEAAEEGGFDVNDQIQVGNFLKRRVNELIDKANAQWEERNAEAIARGEQPIPQMLPLVRLKVDTSDVSEMSNPIRFGLEFQGRIANPKDVLMFHRSRKFMARKALKNEMDGVEWSIDDPSMPASEKLARVRVGALVKEFLTTQEMKLLGEMGMGDAIQLFVEKDEIHSISSYVDKSLSTLMKNVRESGVVDDDNLEEAVKKARKEYEEEYAKQQRTGNTVSNKKNNKKNVGSDAESVDSMMLDDDDLYEDLPPPKKTGKATASKATSRSTATSRSKASSQPKKAPAKGRGRKRAATTESDEEEEDNFIVKEEDEWEQEDEEEEEEKVKVPKPPSPKKRTSRAAVLGQTKAPPKRAPAGRGRGKQGQSALSFAPSGTSQSQTQTQRGRTTSSRTAATTARGRMQKVVEVSDSDE